jgi:hypothetical protein
MGGAAIDIFHAMEKWGRFFHSVENPGKKPPNAHSTISVLIKSDISLLYNLCK